MSKSTSKNKTIRVNKKIENMLETLKVGNSKITETDIFLKGIYIQFEEQSKTKNEAFRRDMHYAISECFPEDIEVYSLEAEERLKAKFDKLCDALEVLSLNDGLLLIWEFTYFIEYICGGVEIEDIYDGKTDYRKNYKPRIDEYESIYSIILRNENSEKDLQLDLKELEEVSKNATFSFVF